MAFTALFDANVLYPAPLRDLLMHLAGTDLFRARWTARIQDEWVNALLGTRPDLKAKLIRTRALMDEAIPECLVEGYEALETGLTLPDMKDCHVLAAAIVGRADVIVTKNLRHFPTSSLAPFRIEAQHPDVFIRHVLDLDEAAVDAVREMRANLKMPPMPIGEFLEMLSRQELPRTVAYLQPLL